MQRVRLGVATTAAVSLVLIATVFVSPAAAGHITCGQTITTSVVLDSDVGPCSTGLIVGADNIVIDLGGHRLFGTANPGEGPGILVRNRSNVTIQSGTVTGFDAGISIEGGSRNTVYAVNVQDNVGFLTGAGFYGDGILVFNSSANHIVNNNVVRNGTFSGISLTSASSNVVENNYVLENNVVQVSAQTGQPRVQQDIGIWVLSIPLVSGGPVVPSRNNVIRTNQVIRNGLDGIQISRFSTENTLDHNNVQSNGVGQLGTTREGDGIAIFGDRNLVSGNSAIANAADGIAVERSRSPRTGQFFPGGEGNQIRGNRSYNNGTGGNPDVNFDLSDDHPNCDANVWVGNAFGTRNQPCIT